MVQGQDFYNIPFDCIDKNAFNPKLKNKTAAIFLDHSNSYLQERRLSFLDLQKAINRAANFFSSAGYPSGARVLLRLPNSAAFPIVFLGAMKAGLISVPTSPLLKAEELEFLICDSGAALIVSTEELLPQKINLAQFSQVPKLLLLNLAAPLFFEDSENYESVPTRADDPAFWLYTSGSSGKPKAVIHAHRSVRAHDARVRSWQDFREDDFIFNTSSLNWSYALTAGMLDVWRHGGTSLIYQGPLDAESLFELLQRYPVTTLMSVPGIYRRLVAFLKKRSVELRYLRVCLSAGEGLPIEIRHEFRDLTGLNIYQGLGMTEHSVYLIQKYGSKIIDKACRPASQDQKIAILREDLTEADPGEVGILASHRSCEGLMLDYWNAETPAFQGDWFLSGDLAYRDVEGNFYFLGRADDTIKAGGFRLSPLEIETVINQHLQVEESLVVSQELEPGKTLIVAYVVTRSPENSESLRQEVLTWLKQKLADYKMPREIVFVKSLPKTTNGKLKRAELREGSDFS